MSEIRIGVNLKGELAKKFLALKRKLAINSNADVVKRLINCFLKKEGDKGVKLFCGLKSK